MPVELLQITDMHLLAGSEETHLGLPPRATFRDVVRKASSEPWDLVLLTGDLSQDGTPASYEGVREEAASLEAPCYWVPGNHDDLSVMTRALEGSPFQADRAFSIGGWQVVLLNTAVPAHTHGELSDEELAFLRGVLADHPDRPTLIAMHHSPVPVGSAWLDPINLREPAAFRAVVEDHPQVRLVLFGHVHQAVEEEWGRTRLYGCPSTCFQFEPGSDEFALDDVEPGFRRVRLEEDGSIETTVQRVSVPYSPNFDTEGYE